MHNSSLTTFNNSLENLAGLVSYNRERGLESPSPEPETLAELAQQALESSAAAAAAASQPLGGAASAAPAISAPRPLSGAAAAAAAAVAAQALGGAASADRDFSVDSESDEDDYGYPFRLNTDDFVGAFSCGNVEWAEGRIVDGYLSGQGKIQYKNGTLEKGFFYRGLLNGYGSCDYYDGRYAEGEFVFGNLSGPRGVYIDHDGAAHTGEFKDFVLHGQGRIVHRSGRIEEGRFENGQLREGKITYPQNGYMEGTFYNGELNGIGKDVQFNATYEGAFVNGKLNGQGKKTDLIRSVLTADFINGTPVGIGVIEYPSGRKEVVEFFGDEYLVIENIPAPQPSDD